MCLRPGKDLGCECPDRQVRSQARESGRERAESGGVESGENGGGRGRGRERERESRAKRARRERGRRRWNHSHILRRRQVTACNGRGCIDNAGGDRRLREWAVEDGFLRGRALCIIVA